MTTRLLAIVATVAFLTAAGCSSTSPEVKALWDESHQLEDHGAPFDDAHLDGFVGRCEDLAHRMKSPDDRFQSLFCALGICRWGGTYEHACSIRVRLMDELTPLAQQDEERQLVLLITFAWMGRQDPHELEREGEEFRGYVDAIARTTNSKTLQAQCIGSKIQYLMEKDGTSVGLSTQERELTLKLIDEIETKVDCIDGKAFGYSGRAQYAADRAALTRNRLGMVADEIEGRDLDGVAFKLSDYRGKVVVLDFWGFW